MVGNGFYRSEADEGRTQHQVMGATSALVAVTSLDRAAEALREAGRALHALTTGVREIHADTSRSISDTVELKRHLKAITDREQELRRELDVVKATMVRKRIKPKKKKRRGK